MPNNQIGNPKSQIPVSEVGVSLIEALVAFMVLSVVGAAVIFLTLQVLAANNAARVRNQVADYAQEAMEQLRGYRQNNGWTKMSTLSSNTTCYKDGRLDGVAGSTTSCAQGPANQIGTSVFYRYVKLSLPSASDLRAEVHVFWTERGITRSTQVDTDFYNY